MAFVYSLVNAPTIGYDLARLPTGAAVATVLLEALAIYTPSGDQADLSAFDPAAVADPRRASAWLEVSALTPEVKLDQALAAAKQVIDDAERTMQMRAHALAPVVAGLTTSYFGGLDDLLRFARLDLLADAPTHVVAMASDALAAAHGGRRLPDDARHLLGGPWITATRSLPAIPADLGPFAHEVTTVLDKLPLLTAPQVVVLAEAAAALEGDWSRRMHEAAWAAYLSGRLRPAATAQFQAVRALRAAGVDAATAARGVWNAISGCLQAVTLHDLLDEVTYGVLVGAWETAMGILG
ncbi:MAG: hypothetical protein ACRDV3_17240 [Acidothermaceae bacterium]